MNLELILIISFALFVVFFLFMGLGYLFQGKCIQGTCGGLNKLFGDKSCELCEHKDECEKGEA